MAAAPTAQAPLESLLQWGRDLTDADGCCLGRGAACQLASMGPRPNGRGWPRGARGRLKQGAWLQWGRDLTDADGHGDVVGRNRTPGVLQWGRDLTDADGRAAPTFTSTRWPSFQWGRDLTDADGLNASQSGSAARGFNGAATNGRGWEGRSSCSPSGLDGFNGAAT